MFQEFVHNSIKHSECNSIVVNVTEDENHFDMKIYDDGKGFYIAPNKSFEGRGLSTMISRIEALSGRAKLSSTEDVGTTIHIKFPIQ